MPINNLPFLTNQKRGGIYFLSPASPKVAETEPEGKILIKIGKSNDIRTRLNQYFLCFPRGYYLYAVVLFNSRLKRETLQKQTNRLETELRKELNSFKITTVSRMQGRQEWFLMSIKDMQRIAHDFKNEHSEWLNKVVIPKKESAFIHQFEIDDEFIDAVEEGFSDEFLMERLKLSQQKRTVEIFGGEKIEVGLKREIKPVKR